MDTIEFLPLGSVVHIKGMIAKVIIITRALATEMNGSMVRFDYGGVTYPEGMISDKLLYFNHDMLEDVVFLGYSDEENAAIVIKLNHWVTTSSFQQGRPIEINRERFASKKMS